MQAQIAATSPLLVALRVGGTMGGLAAVLLVLVALARPEMVMGALHAMMHMVQ
jgi:hypothetical protein